VVVLNGIGTIDSDYTGEIGVILINHGENEFIINHGDRIAQGVISSVIGKQLTNFVKIATINKTTGRGHSGYGSTGHQ
jgi:dUTP pyrophosphatase